MAFEDYWNNLESAGWFAAYREATRKELREALVATWARGPQGRQFTEKFAYLFEDLEPALRRFCNDVVAAAGSPYRFQEVPSGDQWIDCAFTSDAAYERVQSLGYLTVEELPGGEWGARLE